MITINKWAWEFTSTPQELILAGFLESNSSPEGFVGFDMTATSAKLRYFSPLDLRRDLETLQANGVVVDLAFGPKAVGMKMVQPADKWAPKEEEATESMFDDMEGTVWEGIVTYWNQCSILRPKRIGHTQSGGATPNQIAAMKRAWRNEDFRKWWKRSIRVLMVSSYHLGKKVTFSTWVGKAKKSNDLWSMESMKIFNEQRPSLPEEDHLLLYPPPPGWKPEAHNCGSWEELFPKQRELVHETYVKTAKDAI